jgi:hypothetical protein
MSAEVKSEVRDPKAEAEWMRCEELFRRGLRGDVAAQEELYQLMEVTWPLEREGA